MKILKIPSSTLCISHFYAYILLFVVGLCGIFLLWNVIDIHIDKTFDNSELSLDLKDIRHFCLSTDGEESLPRNPKCTIWDCLNIYRCGQSGLTIYVYPIHDYIDSATGKPASSLSREFYDILKAVVDSPYYTSNPNEACLFMPSIDVLNQNALIDTKTINRAYAASDFWVFGENHLIFNMITSKMQKNVTKVRIHTDRSIVLGTFNTWTYRPGFDISLPAWSTYIRDYEISETMNYFNQRQYTLLSSQIIIVPRVRRVVEEMRYNEPNKILQLQKCGKMRCNIVNSHQKYKYPQVMAMSTFCLLSNNGNLAHPDLLEMLANNCIPVIAIDEYILPFEDILDWSLFAIRIRESDLQFLMQQLNSLSNEKILEMRKQGHWIFIRYFKNLATITMTALEILESRIFPHSARTVRQWNTIDSNYQIAQNPLFLPLIAPKSQGFTAVVLTYDRIDSLFILIQKLAMVPSLQSILIIWNNQKKSPPHVSAYPVINKPLKVIQTQSNKLSNRFYPYSEIDTEAILTIDDDIVMLTTDELDFGFEVWREFPDRIVGFPSRIHLWNNETFRWQYDSEWTNQISMVLTGAAFHHKYWSHMYTYAMPGNIKKWVDKHMNCEDIAMNFLVANMTKKAPIKVTPRKKFKCPECTNTEMLSADLNHMRERSACIDLFASIYGHVPLRSVEFRADPVLFKDNFPEKLKRFNDIGSL